MLEKVVLVSVDKGNDAMPAENCLDELSLLVATTGATEVGRLLQKREGWHPKHYLGKGKIEELKDLISLTEATGIVCDDELSGMQLYNLEQMLDTKIMDRTMVILDIFASRANTAEGKVQVELAQLQYNATHLKGIGTALSRLGGGIGTRGPGEKKLETDRRVIKERIAELNRNLKEIEAHRELLRQGKKKSLMPVISLVGYTNAGKSTLMNALTGAGVLAEDKLFATLDTTSRKITLPGGSNVLLTDTVGFIQKLPHHLIKAFRATLEELKHADILVHVVDSAGPMAKEQTDVVIKTLQELKCAHKPLLTVFNKIDAGEPNLQVGDAVSVSALHYIGLDALKIKLEEMLKEFRTRLTVLIPYSEGQLLDIVYGHCEVLTSEHKEDGTYLELYANGEIFNRLKQYSL